MGDRGRSAAVESWETARGGSICVVREMRGKRRSGERRRMIESMSLREGDLG